MIAKRVLFSTANVEYQIHESCVPTVIHTRVWKVQKNYMRLRLDMLFD